MLNQDHPDDERLSALASLETDATSDATLTAHVSSCDRCTDLTSELGALRLALADLPDMKPSRPLQLLPPVESHGSRVDRVGDWARRFFAPVLAAGAAVAMVGVVGTAAPALDQLASGPSADRAATEEVAAPQASAGAGSEAGGEPAGLSASADTLGSTGGSVTGESDDAADASPRVNDYGTAADSQRDALGEGMDEAETSQQAASERSPWPMVLFTGVALMVGAVLLRWILAPRVA